MSNTTLTNPVYNHRVKQFIRLALTMFAVEAGCIAVSAHAAAGENAAKSYTARGDFDGDGRQDVVRLDTGGQGMPLLLSLGNGSERRIPTMTTAATLPRVSVEFVPSGSVFEDVNGGSFRLLHDGFALRNFESSVAIYFFDGNDITRRFTED